MEVLKTTHLEAGNQQQRLLAQHLNHLISLEAKDKPDYQVNRSPAWYERSLCGVNSLFEYLKTIKTSNKVLDIGSGLTIGIHGLSERKVAEGLDFIGTGLVRRDEIQNFLGHERFMVTAAELLNGIQNQSIAGVLGVYSLAYSFPELAVARLDQILVPGGVIKANFRGKTPTGEPVPHDFYDKTDFKTHDPFSEILISLGYDLATTIDLDDVSEVMLAVKPGSNQQVSARELLFNDKNNYRTPSNLN